MNFLWTRPTLLLLSLLAFLICAYTWIFPMKEVSTIKMDRLHNCGGPWERRTDGTIIDRHDPYVIVPSHAILLDPSDYIIPVMLGHEDLEVNAVSISTADASYQIEWDGKQPILLDAKSLKAEDSGDPPFRGFQAGTQYRLDVGHSVFDAGSSLRCFSVRWQAGIEVHDSIHFGLGLAGR